MISVMFCYDLGTKAFESILEVMIMSIGNVIRKYRKEAGFTQEEMANRLGVTTPAVNKWENNNSNPDIELLAPIARLLHISLDTLLSFQAELTEMEIGNIVQEVNDLCDLEGFEKAYERVLEIVRKYPNCNMLIWQMAVILDARRLTGEVENSEKYDEQINSWYETALNDEREEVRRHAAESLFGFYLRKKQYEKAEGYLEYFSENDPMKKIYQGRLYKEQGDCEKAYEIFEGVLFSTYQILNFTFSLMIGQALESGDMQAARYFAGKIGTLAGVFEMGKYYECSPMLDVVCSEKNVEETYQVVEQLLNHVDSLFDFQKSRMYQHMKFREPDSNDTVILKGKLLDLFKYEDDFGYMKVNEDWERLLSSGHE